MRLPPAHPTPWLLLDACAALVTAFTHAVLLREVLPFTGMPAEALSILAVLAAGFATYSVCCWTLAVRAFVTVATAGRLLRVIALANFMFVALSFVLVVVYWAEVTMLGVGYFVAEAVVVVLLARREWRVGMVAAHVF